MQITNASIKEIIQDPENAEQVQQSREFFARLLSRSMTDPEFRELLVTSPKVALASYFDEIYDQAARPEDIPWDVRFIEPIGDVTYVLPDVIDGDAELSDEELTAVAGGALPVLVVFLGAYLLSAGATAGVYAGIKVLAQIGD